MQGVLTLWWIRNKSRYKVDNDTQMEVTTISDPTYDYYLPLCIYDRDYVKSVYQINNKTQVDRSFLTQNDWGYSGYIY